MPARSERTMQPSGTSLRFGRCELRPSERRLLIDAQPAALGARAFDVLVALIERRDRLVSKSELLDVVWPDTVVEENNLQVHISALRKLLGQSAIATIPGRGYRFTLIAQDEGASHMQAPQAPAPAQRTNIAAAVEPLIGRAA